MGYNEIVESGKLKDYTEGLFRVETWELSDRLAECVWLPQNEGIFPTTIYYKNK